jgi:uncharacterized protein (TIGR03000 family)
MYSVVLMMALSGGAAEAPAGHGCCGGCWGSCGGYSCGGYSCGSCHGCHGGWSSCHGCSGGYSCCGGGHGCHGGFFHRHSCCGGCNGCYGGGCYGGYSCGGGCYGGYSCGGGCYGGYSCGGGCHGAVIMEGGAAAGATDKGTKTDKKDGKKEEKKKSEGDDDQTSISAPATIVVTLPADAKLTIGDTLTQSTSAVRTFSSPALDRGQDYYYTLKAEVVRDGRTVTTSKQVTVRAGSESRVTIDFPAGTVAQR